MTRVVLLAFVCLSPIVARRDSYMCVKAEMDIKSLESAIQMFYLDVGRAPTLEEGLYALVKALSEAEDWNGPYAAKIYRDPWGNDYTYTEAETSEYG